MISHIHIKNFQSLSDVSIEPGQFTIISGESDIGKSAIVRALSALITNKSGQAFIKRGSTHCSVFIDIDDGNGIGWIKGKSSIYTINGKSFEKVGTSVPDEISEVLRMGEIDVGGIKVSPNIHDQFSTPFLVSETGSFRAKVLGELSGVNVLFSASQEARRREQAAKRLRGVRLEDKQSLDGELEKFSYLKEWLVRLGECKFIFSVCEKLEGDVRKIEDILVHSESLERLKAEASVALESSKILDNALRDTETSFNEVEQLTARIEEVKALEEALYAVRGSEGILKNELLMVEKEIEDLEVCPTCGQVLCLEKVVG